MLLKPLVHVLNSLLGLESEVLLILGELVLNLGEEELLIGLVYLDVHSVYVLLNRLVDAILNRVERPLLVKGLTIAAQLGVKDRLVLIKFMCEFRAFR